MKTYTYLSIEANGRYFRRSHLTYVGLAWYEKNQIIYREWFPTKEEEEPEVLEELFAFLLNFQEIKTYNGSGFALPYLKNKAKAYRIACCLDEIAHDDLRYTYAPLKKPLGLLSMKQRDLESFLGLASDLERKSYELGDSLRNMPYLKAFDNYLTYFTSPPKNITASILEDKLCLSFDNPIKLPKAFHIAKDLFYMKVKKDKTQILLPLLKGSLKCYFKNYKDYYYLPLEDTAIHKSLGSFVDKSRRQKASPKTCFQKKEGIFYPLFNHEISELFVCKYDYDDPIAYQILDRRQIESQDWLEKYVDSIFHFVF